MTDYFGALLRSAGAVPADATARATPPDTADLFEQELEVEVATESVAAAQPAESPPAIEPASHTPTEATPASPEPREVRRSEPVKSPLTGPALDEVHPVVRAALDWVAADPEGGERAVSEVHEHARGSDPAPRRQSPPVVSQPARTARPAAADVTVAAAATQPVRTERPPQSPPLPRIEVEAEPAPQRQAAVPPHPSAVRELDFKLPRASRTRQDAIKTIDDAVPGPQDRTEVSIGTIHVRVDAPAPRVVAQPAQPPQRPPQPAPPADRGGFSRSRLPRV